MKKNQIETWLKWVMDVKKQLAQYKEEYEKNEKMIKFYKAS